MFSFLSLLLRVLFAHYIIISQATFTGRTGIEKHQKLKLLPSVEPIGGCWWTKTSGCPTAWRSTPSPSCCVGQMQVTALRMDQMSPLSGKSSSVFSLLVPARHSIPFHCPGPKAWVGRGDLQLLHPWAEKLLQNQWIQWACVYLFAWPGNPLAFDKERRSWSAHSLTEQAGASYTTTSTTPSASLVTPVTSTTPTGDGKGRKPTPEGENMCWKPGLKPHQNPGLSPSAVPCWAAAACGASLGHRRVVQKQLHLPGRDGNGAVVFSN